MVMGRPQKGVSHIDSCEGSDLGKQRAKVVLQTIQGELSTKDACARLGVQWAWFRELRERALQGCVEAMEPQRPGRRPKQLSEAEQEAEALRAKIEDLEQRLKVAETRAEIAELRLPQQKGGFVPPWRQ